MTDTVTLTLRRLEVEKISEWEYRRMGYECPGCGMLWQPARGYDHAVRCPVLALAKAAKTALLNAAEEERGNE